MAKTEDTVALQKGAIAPSQKEQTLHNKKAIEASLRMLRNDV